MDIWNIATHESGHSLCLGDLYGGGDSAKTMYGYASNCDTHARTLHSDDINGIIAIYGSGSGDSDPPTPNPMTFATVPYAAGTSQINMVATTGSDASPPVQYYFDFTTGAANGDDSDWQTSTSYSDTGLIANSQLQLPRARPATATPCPTSARTRRSTRRQR